MNLSETIVSQKLDFLLFLKSKFSLIHNSNVFFRDLQYGIMEYLEDKKIKKLKYLDGEDVAKTVSSEFEKEGIFVKIDHQSWRLNYPDFTLPRVEKKVP